jgi:quercetin dioxygenase-like cupin family protein
MASLSSEMIEETLHNRGTTAVRRLFLAPGEATRWHQDPFHRVSVVLKGDVLAIEFHDGRPKEHVKVIPGQVDWDEPSDRIHRAVNVGDVPYEEITVFFLAHPDDIPQPDAL